MVATAPPSTARRPPRTAPEGHVPNDSRSTTTVVHEVPTRLGTLAVREYPAGGHGSRTALLWHSMFTDSRSWSRVAPELARHRRLLIVDGPGYGRSAELTRASSIG